MPVGIVWWAIAACTGAPGEPALTLEGPAEVRVDALGPIANPRVLRGDGTEAAQLAWTVSDPTIATVREGAVVAVGAGATDVTGVLGDDRVVYRLIVEPAVALKFAQPPMGLRVGQTLELSLEGGHADVEWITSNPAIATVQTGRITGVGTGIVYISARKGTSEAMLQLDVLAADPTPP